MCSCVFTPCHVSPACVFPCSLSVPTNVRHLFHACACARVCVCVCACVYVIKLIAITQGNGLIYGSEKSKLCICCTVAPVWLSAVEPTHRRWNVDAAPEATSCAEVLQAVRSSKASINIHIMLQQPPLNAGNATL
mmetsp:Transcript_15173/g.44701  ORF Transcript_15173/g.44701 Transcript_15173/m.44701 type:complete len:135 (-) Transcript_15173:222-626(-)